jgi:hypothetical protein
MAQLAARDAQLRGQAANSGLGNLAGATQRLGQPAGQMPASVSQWLDKMQAAGIDRDMARSVLLQTHLNQKALTPELTDSVRRGQMQTDLQPRIDQQLQQLAPANRERMLPAVQEEVAARAGYRDAGEMQALHGPAAQGVRDMFAWGKQQAQQAAQLSGQGTHGPLTRMVDAVQNATPQTSGHDLLRAGLNVVPTGALTRGAS